ncbi:MAG: PaaI family thioesterase [Chloroflexi bacterium]|nr:PaaI family thioesterase [Chloroflexota bacterium]
MDAADPGFPQDAAGWNQRGEGHFPGLIGLVVTDVGHGFCGGRLEVATKHLAPNGFLHAATVVGIADTLCGYGCNVSLPEGAAGFTTIELKSNFIGTARDGAISAKAHLIHGGRMTQVWDADVIDEATGKAIATFRCTQMVLYPR